MVDYAAGHPDYGSAGTSSFIPALWEGNMVDNFYDATVFNAISTTKYSGKIKSVGDKVHIRTVPEITVSAYVKGQGLVYEKPEKADVELEIDKAYSFQFELNDVDDYQSDLDLMKAFTMDATERLKIQVDTDVLGSVYADAAATNKGATAGKVSSSFNLGASGSPVALTKANILDYIVDLGTVLDETSTPETNRKLTLPAWAVGLIKKSDIKDASLAGDGTSIMRNGRVGVIDRFEVYSSNNISTGTDSTDTVYNILANHPSCIAFAAQITDTETLPNPNDFGELCRGLVVFGSKVVQPDGVAHGYVKRG